ncbi:MAG: hypothetical protein VX125_02905 [Pseudomonadota bacterium]|uniref:hypothetical protein n=1 Tax=Acinetobacter bereziniae TaxID=106648 RepID=UPI0012502E43|nr:hypothetical protein [Acinetobacter bereziniae]MEC8122795.1 hypothetical protein [Pseudomonadota bacterium]
MNKLRIEIEPDFETAQQLYPTVLELIANYTRFCDEFGDENSVEYQKLSEKLTQITLKDISQYDLWEWWEAEGIENLSFDICLPEPKIIKDISKQELTEIVQRIKKSDFTAQHKNNFIHSFYIRTVFPGGYFYNFLKLNFKYFHHRLFQRNKDQNGKYFEYSTEEIVEQLWAKKSK